MSARERVLQRLKDWAARQIENRLRREWEEYRADPRVRLPRFRRHGDATHTSRSLIEINFHRHER